MLLQWCTLKPLGPDNLAAVKFPSAVRIRSISIFPTNHQPFALSPEVVSHTEPEAFFLDLYFNAHPVVPRGSKEKAKPTNALFTTSIAYAGGCMDFKVNMSSETATRLMIVKGDFESVSMAVYGDVVDELPPPATNYEARVLPTLDPIPLSEALDPANSRGPTRLAAQLLQLIPDSPTLPLITRLMFCIKPSNDDWDRPEFPHLYAELDKLPDGADVQEAYRLASHPLPDGRDVVPYVEFAEKVAQGLTSPNDTQSYYLAALLSDAACQPASMSAALLEGLDMNTILDPSTLDEDTLDKLLDAASNTAIARRFNDPTFREIISSVEKNTKNDRFTRTRARELLARIDGMLTLEDAISNTQGDFAAAAETLKSVGSQEKSLGILLTTFMTYPDLVDKLAENPTQSASLQSLPRLFSDPKALASHDEFIAFLRAFIGVASVLAVYAWADSIPDVQCRERALGILRLWQGVDGYREILNHLLLLRQMVFRLNCMLDTELPTKACIYAENIVLDMAKDPSSILRTVFREAILKFELPHCVITDEEQSSMQRAADIADKGLDSAVEFLLQPMERSPTFEYVRALRVALKIIDEELIEGDEYDVLTEVWEQGECNLEALLANILTDLSEEVCIHFSVRAPPATPSDVLAHLLWAANEVMHILIRIVPAYPAPSRLLRCLVTAAASLFTTTDLADILFTQTSSRCIAAQQMRQTCVVLIRTLAEISELLPGGRLPAELVLRTLLEHGLRSGDHEPAHHLLQVFCLVDYLLPTSEAMDTSVSWPQKVLPNVLRELWAFCRVLDTENKAHLVRRLIAVDNGSIGIGDWLLQEELKDLGRTLRRLGDFGASPQEQLLSQYQVSLSLHFLLELLSASSPECNGLLISNTSLARSFAGCLQVCLTENIVSPHLRDILNNLASRSEPIPEVLKFDLALALLRSCQHPDVPASDITTSLYLAHAVLVTCPPDLLADASSEISNLLHSLGSSQVLGEGDLATALVGLLEWFSEVKDATLAGYDPASFSDFCDKLVESLEPVKRDALARLKTSFQFTDDIVPMHAPTILPHTLSLSIHDLSDLLRPKVAPPTTPPRKPISQDVLALVTISPPTAVIRSPAATGLTKTYSNNDFRQLRQTPSARQNTSRLPSMHVDDFENAALSPTIPSLPMPIPGPVPLAAAGPSVVPGALPLAPDAFASVSPVFKVL